MRSHRVLGLLFLSLLVSSCGVVDNGDDGKIPLPPDDPGTPSTPSTPDDPGTPSTPTTPDDPGTPSTNTNRIKVADHSRFYYVGETFNAVSRLDLTLVLNGAEKDLSFRPSYYEVKMKDPSGKAYDPDTPFVTSGEYTYEFVYKGDATITSGEKKFTVSPSPSNVYKKKTELPDSFDYKAIEGSAGGFQCFPSKGEINALVFPVEFSDYPFASGDYGASAVDRIDVLFNGDGPAETGYWESVSSYYKKVSMGQLEFHYDLAETYHPSMTAMELATTGDLGSILSGAFNGYVEKYGASAMKKYDNDSDGYVDGVWFVYSAPHYGSGAYGDAPAMKTMWAFCSCSYGSEPNVDAPVLGDYGWISTQFMNEGVDAPAVDAHTFTHESGHLLGLPDYYSYDFSGIGASGPQGGIAMMDLNIGDQDSFSKIALGWSDPYYVTEDCVVELKPNEASGDCILLADNWNGTAFDEYILLDLETPTGINKMDAETAYPGRQKYYNTPGIRAYHVDARLAKYALDSNGSFGLVKESGQTDYYMTDSQVEKAVYAGPIGRATMDPKVPVAERKPGYKVVNANSSSRSAISEAPYNNNRLLMLIGGDNKLCENDDVGASDASLFTAGDSWTLNGRTVKFFTGDMGKFNNNDAFHYAFTVLSCDMNGAKVQIRRYR